MSARIWLSAVFAATSIALGGCFSQGPLECFSDDECGACSACHNGSCIAVCFDAWIPSDAVVIRDVQNEDVEAIDASILDADLGATDSAQPDALDADAEPGDVDLFEARLSITPAQHHFGEHITGKTTGLRTFTVENAGNLTTGTIATTLSGAGAFQPSRDTCSGAALAPSGTCTIDVELASSMNGTISASLEVFASPGGLASAWMTARVLSDARLMFEPPAIELSRGFVGVARELELTIFNVGEVGASSIDERIAGTNADELTILQSCGAQLAPGASCVVRLRHEPTIPGLKSAVLIVNAARGGTTLANFSAAIADRPDLLIEPEHLFLGTSTVSGRISGRRLLIKNVGVESSGPLDTLPIGGTNASIARIVQDTCEGHSLSPGATCEVGIEFHSMPIGGATALVGVGGALIDPAIATVVAATSTIPAPGPSAQMPWLDFGEAVVNTTGATIYFRLYDLSSFTTSYSGANATEFTTVYSSCTTNPGFCELGVRFAPQGVGVRTATLAVNGSNSTVNIPLEGTSIAAGSTHLRFDPVVAPFIGRAINVNPIYMELRSSLPITTGPIQLTFSGDSEITLSDDLCSGRTLRTNRLCTFRINVAAVDRFISGTLTASATPGGVTVLPIYGRVTDRGGVRLVASNSSGSGRVIGPGIDCRDDCEESFDPNTQVTLTAVPDSSSVFVEWRGACSGAGNCTLTVLTDVYDVEARFERRAPLLSVDIELDTGAGGFVESAPLGITCSGDCEQTYTYGTTVVLHAHPAQGSFFERWTGACEGIGSTCVVSMTNARAVSASFAPANIAFIASVSSNLSDFRDPTSLDARCDQLAQTAGLGGVYRAWVSTSTSATTRISSVEPHPRGWVRIDGSPFADTLAALSRGEVIYPVRYSDLGVASTASYATGTWPDGHDGLNCFAWTSSAAHVHFLAGSPSAGTAGWTASTSFESCDRASSSFLCLGVGSSVEVDVTPAGDRYAFISEAVWDPSSGIAAADALCQSEADLAGLSGTYGAWLATSAFSPLARIALGSAGWTRSDGAPIVGAPSDIDDPSGLIAPITVHAGGAYSSQPFAWTGTQGALDVPSSAPFTCNDWSSSSGAGGALGVVSETSLLWSASGLVVDCGEWHPVYCFEL